MRFSERYLVTNRSSLLSKFVYHLVVKVLSIAFEFPENV
jgi:hypothetical protein